MSKKKKLKYMALDADFANSFKSLAASEGKKIVDLSRELANDPSKLALKLSNEKKKKKVRGIDYGF